MKPMKKVIALVSALTLVCSLFAISASAADATSTAPYVIDAKTTNPYNYQEICGFEIDVTDKGPGVNYMASIAVGNYASAAAFGSATPLCIFDSTAYNQGTGKGSIVDMSVNGTGKWTYQGATPIFSSSESHLSINLSTTNTYSVDKVIWLDKDGNAVPCPKLPKGSVSIAFDAKITNPDNYNEIYGFKINATNTGTLGIYMTSAAVGSFTDSASLQAAAITNFCATAVKSMAPAGSTVVDIAAGASADWSYVGTSPLFSSDSRLMLGEGGNMTGFDINSVVWLDKNGDPLVNVAKIVDNSSSSSSSSSSSASSSASAATNSTNPKTGDNSTSIMMIFVSLAAVAATGLFLTKTRKASSK